MIHPILNLWDLNPSKWWNGLSDLFHFPDFSTSQLLSRRKLFRPFQSWIWTRLPPRSLSGNEVEFLRSLPLRPRLLAMSHMTAELSKSQLKDQLPICFGENGGLYHTTPKCLRVCLLQDALDCPPSQQESVVEGSLVFCRYGYDLEKKQVSLFWCLWSLFSFQGMLETSVFLNNVILHWFWMLSGWGVLGGAEEHPAL